MLGLVNKEADFEDNPFFNWNPMEILGIPSTSLAAAFYTLCSFIISQTGSPLYRELKESSLDVTRA